MISIEQVTKKFGGIRALDQVEAQISAAAGGRAGED